MRREPMLHPVVVVREKYEPNKLFTGTHTINRAYEKYSECREAFNVSCVELMKELISSQSSLDKSQYMKLKKKLKKQSSLISLAGSESGHEATDRLLDQHEKRRQDLLEAIQAFKTNFAVVETSDRVELKRFLQENPALRNMLFTMNGTLYHSTERYLNDEMDTHKKKLRKVEIPLAKIVTRATAKTSPNFHFNTVAFHSDRIPGFQYTVKQNQMTPNYVFFHRMMEHILLSDPYMRFAKFLINSRITQDEQSVLYIFKNESDNYKIHKSKDVLYKTQNSRLITMLHEHVGDAVDISFFCSRLNVTTEQSANLIRRLVDIGVLELQQHLTDRLDIFREFADTLVEVIAEPGEVIIELLTLTQNLAECFDKLNQNFKIDLYQEITGIYARMAELLEIDMPEQHLLIYGDQVGEQQQAEEEHLSDHIGRLLSVFPVFDINEKIKNEFAHEVAPHMIDGRLPMDHPAIMKVLTDVNLKYGRYWSDPWCRFETESETNRFLFGLQDELVGELLQHGEETEELDLTDALNEMSERLNKQGIRREGYYSVFYQHDGSGRTIVNKIYPGYGSFYQRFLRYTDILERYTGEIESFYESDRYELAELHETLAFNANVVDKPYFRTKYMDVLSKKHGHKDIYGHHVHEDACELRQQDEDFVLANGEGQYKPVISSSLIRALYPGKFAFVTSIFSNISFINDLSLFWLNKRIPGEVVIAPRMCYEDIVLERRRLFCETSALLNETEHEEELLYLAIREKMTVLGIGERFYIQARKKAFEDQPIRSTAFEFDKPQYIDLGNVLLYRLLLNILNTRAEVLISEELPDGLHTKEYMREVRAYCGTLPQANPFTERAEDLQRAVYT